MSFVRSLVPNPQRIFYISDFARINDTAKMSDSVRDTFLKMGMSEKYCGPHALATSLQLLSSKTTLPQIVDQFNVDEVVKGGTTTREISQALAYLTERRAVESPFKGLKRIEAVLKRQKPILALIQQKEEPVEHHWLTLIGMNAHHYVYLNFGRIEMIRKQDFSRVCREFVYPS